MEWTFRPDGNNKRGYCQDCRTSSAIGVPSPGAGTRVHINLWLQTGSYLTETEEAHVVISDFQYEPLNGAEPANLSSPYPVRLMTDHDHVEYAGSDVDRLVPIRRDVFENARISLDETLCILSTALRRAISVTSGISVHEWNTVLLAYDPQLEGGMGMLWNLDPPVIGVSPSTGIVGQMAILALPCSYTNWDTSLA